MSDDSGNKNLLIILLGVWVGYSMHYLFWPEAALETQHCYAMLPVAVGQICYVFVSLLPVAVGQVCYVFVSLLLQ